MSDPNRQRHAWKFASLYLAAVIVVPLWLAGAPSRLIEFVLVALVCASWCYQARIADEVNERIDQLQAMIDQLRAPTSRG